VGHTVPLEAEAAAVVVAEAAAVVVAEPLVGRTGASGERVLVDSLPPRHDAPVAQVRPLAQHPPPRDTGHEYHPIEHVYTELEVDTGSGVMLVEDDVGATTTAVEVKAGAELDEGGWM